MSITGYYDGTVVHVDKPLQMNQRVVVIPIESELDLEESADIIRKLREESCGL